MIRTIAFIGCFALLATSALADGNGNEKESSISVCTAKGSAFVRIAIKHHKELGKVRIAVKDAAGRTLYSEEGRAYTDELIRNLDRASFPSGRLVLTVNARDLSISQPFSVDGSPTGSH